jgi:MFS family permease
MARAVRTIEQDNFHRLVMDIAWFGIGLAATSQFLSVYAIRLGATETELGWIASLPAIFLALSTTFGGWWMRRYSDSVRALFWPALFFRFIFFLPALVPFFPQEWRLTMLILAATLPSLGQGIGGVVFIVMMRQAIDDTRLAALLSRRSLALNVAIGLGALVFAFWLEVAPFPMNYQVMFLIAFIFSLFSQAQLIWIRVKPIQLAPTPAAPSIKSIVIPLKSHSFQRVAMVVLLTHAAFFAIRPIIQLHLVDDLGASEWFMGQFALAELVAGALISPFGSRIMARFGYRNVIAASMVGTAVAAIIIATATNLSVTLFAAVISGASWTLGAVIGLFGFFAENTAVEDMPRFSAPYHQLLALGMFIGPLLGTGLANLGLSLVAVILIGGVFRFISGLVIHYNPTNHDWLHSLDWLRLKFR